MARDLAIDLGTANTLVYMKGRGIVLNEPSVIALNRQTGEVLATGREAWQMIGRTPGYIVAVRPLRGGAITDCEITDNTATYSGGGLYAAGTADLILDGCTVSGKKDAESFLQKHCDDASNEQELH